jgi:hypothetical protein
MITIHARCWFIQDPKRLTPTVALRGVAFDMFNADNIQIETVLDCFVVSRPRDLFRAFCSVIALYWVFDIAYADKLQKTLIFLASNVCKLESFKPSAVIQRRLNILYSL